MHQLRRKASLLCFDCVPQPLGARCDSGQCVPTDLGCPDFSETPLTTVTTTQLVQNAATHDGQVRWIRGAVIPGEGSCDGEGCNAAYRSMLNGVVRLDTHPRRGLAQKADSRAVDGI
jgi:hypothetical protein